MYQNTAISKQPLPVSEASDRPPLLLSRGGHGEKGSRQRDVINRHPLMLKCYEPQVTRKSLHLASFSKSSDYLVGGLAAGLGYTALPRGGGTGCVDIRERKNVSFSFFLFALLEEAYPASNAIGFTTFLGRHHCLSPSLGHTTLAGNVALLPELSSAPGGPQESSQGLS